MNGYANQYLTNAVQSASPEQLMLMLYDGAVRFLNLGVQAIDNQEIDKRAYYINKASAIISEFAATLDHEQDAALAENLNALYMYMLKRLMHGNMKNDPQCLIEVRDMLSDLRGTWDQAIKITHEEQHPTTTPEPQQPRSISVAL